MAATFSFEQAVGAGFRLIRRRPKTVLGWGAAMAAPVVLMGWLWLAMMASIDPAALESGVQAFAAMIQLQIGLQMLNLVNLALYVMLTAAVFRAVAYPDRRARFLDLRVGMDELRVLLAGAALILGFYVALAVIMLISVAAGAAFWNLSRPLAVIVGVMVGLAGMVVAIWGLLRASLIAPASVMLRDFAFVRGWALTRGQVLPLLGLNLAIMIILMVLQVVIVMAVLSVVVILGFASWAVIGGALHDWFVSADGPTTIPTVRWPLAIGLGLAALPLLSAVYGVTIALSWAPQASACQQLLAQTGRDET